MPARKQSAARPHRLYRSEKNRIIAGVAGGMGEYFGIDPTIPRIIFVLLTIFGGSGILLYILLWIIIPTESAVRDSPEEHIKRGVEEMKTKADEWAGSMRGDQSRYWWGVILIIAGLLFLLGNFGIVSGMHLARWWPLILVAFGLAILLRR